MPSTFGPARTAPRGLLTTLGLIALFVTAPLWLAAFVVGGVLYLAALGALYAVVWFWWIGRARHRVLFVYSDSPNWKQHIEQRIIPRLPRTAVVLNWSDRARWRRASLPVILFKAFSGERDFNPVALVFTRFARVEPFRFRQALNDAKHGKRDSLRTLEAALFERLEI